MESMPGRGARHRSMNNDDVLENAVNSVALKHEIIRENYGMQDRQYYERFDNVMLLPSKFTM